jgi:hypothetical protein
MPTSYYVSPTGSDSNNGAIGTPWATLMGAYGKLVPGDTLYFRGGVYNYDFLSWDAVWPDSGSSGSPITITNYPGEHPIIDGGANQSGFIAFQGANFVTLSGLEFRHYLNNPV